MSFHRLTVINRPLAVPGSPPVPSLCTRIATNQRGLPGALLEPDPPGNTSGVYKWTGGTSLAEGPHEKFRYEAVGNSTAATIIGSSVDVEGGTSGSAVYSGQIGGIQDSDSIVTVVAAWQASVNATAVGAIDGIPDGNSPIPLSVATSGDISVGIGVLPTPLGGVNGVFGGVSSANAFRWCMAFGVRGANDPIAGGPNDTPVTDTEASGTPSFTLTPTTTGQNLLFGVWMSNVVGGSAHSLDQDFTEHLRVALGNSQLTIFSISIPASQSSDTMTVSIPGWTSETNVGAGVTIQPGSDAYQQYIVMSSVTGGPFQTDELLTASLI